LVGLQGTLVTAFLIVITIHNPTHRIYNIRVTGAKLDAELTSGSLNTHVQAFFVVTPANYLLIWTGAYWTDLAGSTELKACSPISLALSFYSQKLPFRPVDKGMFHLNLHVIINGTKASFTSDFMTKFVTTPTQTTTPTTAQTPTVRSTVSTGPYKPPNECVFPWV
jgi:hypothetical protein